MAEYLKEVGALSHEFSRLLAEALGLAPDALAPFYGNPEDLQHRGKVPLSFVRFDPHSLRLR